MFFYIILNVQRICWQQNCWQQICCKIEKWEVLMKKLVREVGPWVEKDRFWNRETELAALVEFLDEGANILITAPRRIGKTSLIRESDNRINNRYYCLQLDLQKSHSPADVITEMSVATRPFLNLWKKTKEIFKNILSSASNNIDSLNVSDLTIKLRDGLLTNWQNKGDRLIEGISEADMPVIVYMDEFPLVINRLLKGNDYSITPERLKEAESFLSWIRSITIQYKQKIRFVITGSIGLEPILKEAGLSHTINTFTPFELESWDKETTINCLQALANNYKVIFSKGVREKVVDLLGCCIPHHVQMFFHYIYIELKRRNNMRCTIQDVESVYYSRMLSTRGHAELSTYEERLKMVLHGDLLPLALELLTETAVAGKLTPKAIQILSQDFNINNLNPQESIREIIGILEHDGYISKESNGYVFVSKLVRDWWKARFAYQYIPVLDRESRL
jgi:hypothetical protein